MGNKPKSEQARINRRRAEARRRNRKIRNLDPDAKREYYRSVHLRKRFHLDPNGYARLLKAQGGVCAICGEVCTALPSMPIDHDHDTGRIRGILCVTCNMGLGGFKDDPAKLANAIVYLADPPAYRLLPRPRQEVLSL